MRPRVLERFGIDPARPIVTQISRFDRLKDPVESSALSYRQAVQGLSISPGGRGRIG